MYILDPLVQYEHIACNLELTNDTCLVYAPSSAHCRIWVPFGL
jgi:hypothetical protein